MLGELAKGLIAPVAGLIGKRQDREAAKVNFAGALAQAEQAGEQELKVKTADLQLLRTQLQQGSWKDEYLLIWVTAIFTLPLLFGLVGRTDELEVVNDYISQHFPPGIIAALVAGIFGVNAWKR